MARNGMNDLLKNRMAASQQASELQASDEAYQKLFREVPPPGAVQICSLPLDKLVPFFTADTGFRPYTPSQLEAFAEQLKEEGLLVRIMAILAKGRERQNVERALAKIAKGTTLENWSLSSLALPSTRFARPSS